MSEEEQEVKIKDRRRFLSEEAEAAGEDATVREKKPAAQSHDREQPSMNTPEVNFSSFVLGLSTQAAICLGEIQNPQEGKVHQDLEAARQMIDILGMLQAKTHGNLDPGEEQLLEQLLYDLRMRFVKLSKH